MERIAFIGEGIFIFWSPIIIAMAAVAAMGFYAALYIKKEGNMLALCSSIFLSVLLSIPLSRLVHWYCKPGTYESLAAAMTDMSNGGFALLGVFAGCFLAAALLRLCRISKNLPAMLDCMSIAGGFGIAIGRLESMFNSSNRGMIVSDALEFPFAYPLVNVVSGATQNRLATFMIQSFVAAGIAALLLIYLIISKIRKKKVRDGDVCLIFLLVYCAGQIICDSARYDALVLRSNGFISMVQVVSLIGMLIPVVVFSARLVKKTKMKAGYFAIWGAMIAAYGVAGYMEYVVQNNGSKALMAYSTMSGGLGVVILLTLVLRMLQLKALREENVLTEVPVQSEEPAENMAVD